MKKSTIDNMRTSEDIYNDAKRFSKHTNIPLTELEIVFLAMKGYARQALDAVEEELPLINETYVVIDKNSSLKRLTIFHDPKPTIHMIIDQLK